ncbi:BRO-N domain-containing protein [Bacteroides heparinolyticus]|uniref:BRO-N domain-containing protein n=1 Tax=Prevotella heparinolytica TaxID=28113 RepID=UPI0035A187CB
MNLNYKGNEVRTVNKNGEVWWVLADVCKILELSNSRETSKRLDDDEKDDVSIIDTIGRKQTVTAINESGLYNLIFQSRKPEAKPFRKWVTSEVLPSIRKTGKYEMKPVVSEESKGKGIRILKLNGMEVVSNSDIARYAGVTNVTVLGYSKVIGEYGVLVDGKELERLKRDNPTLSKFISVMTVHCLSGAEKILRAMGVPMRLVPVKIPTKAVNEIPLIPKETVNNWFPKSLRDPVVRDDTRKAFEYAIRKISDKDVPKELREAYIAVANDIYMRTHPYLEHC